MVLCKFFAEMFRLAGLCCSVVQSVVVEREGKLDLMHRYSKVSVYQQGRKKVPWMGF